MVSRSRSTSGTHLRTDGATSDTATSPPRSALAVDIGGSGLRAARVFSDGTTDSLASEPLSADLTTDDLLERLRAALDQLPSTSGEVAVGVSIPGFVDDTGRIRFSVNMPGLEGVDLAEMLGDSLSAQAVTVVPDIAAATVAEAQLGTGHAVSRFVCVAIGTGVNAALAVDGSILATVAGCLGDAGHVVVEPEGPRCSCGGTGCLESVCSGAAFARDGSVHGLADAEAVVSAAHSGNEAAGMIIARAGRALGRAIATWSVMLWPERVAVAGGVSNAGELLLAPARIELARVGVPYLTGDVEIVPAAFADRAGLVGAGLSALTAAGACP